MATVLQSTVAFEEDQLFGVRYQDRKYSHQGFVDLRPRLNAILQRTLDMNELMELFYAEIQPVVAVDSCHYTFRAERLEINVGERSVHKCSYRLITKDDYLGELHFTKSRRFSELDTKILESLITSLIYPLRNALRYREAVKKALTDSLTGAGNRVALESSLQREFDLVTRYEQPLSVMMIDIDRFKSINDRFGHAAGDTVLKQVVNEIKRTSRCADMLFRYGGEEFVLVLNKTGAEGARIIAERLRASIAGLSCLHEDIEIPVTISVGCATLNAGECKEALLGRADMAVYAAKKDGRNRVVSAETLDS